MIINWYKLCKKLANRITKTKGSDLEERIITNLEIGRYTPTLNRDIDKVCDVLANNLYTANEGFRVVVRKAGLDMNELPELLPPRVRKYKCELEVSQGLLRNKIEAIFCNTSKKYRVLVVGTRHISIQVSFYSTVSEELHLYLLNKGFKKAYMYDSYKIKLNKENLRLLLAILADYKEVI